MKPLISLIIPVYNVEKYLDKCMKSVLAQTYDNFEVILVDDGSTDNSGKMCDEYAEKDSRVRVYHKENEGQSVARNFGVKCANAEYISFIDADDYVAIDYLEYLWTLMEKYNAELSVAHFIRINENQNNTISYNDKYFEVCLNSENAMQRLCVGDGISPVAIGKLFRKESLKNNSFPENVYYEDVATIYKLLFDSKNVSVGSKIIYYYVQHGNSSLHSVVNEKHMYGLIAAENMYNFICSNFPALTLYAHVRCCTTSMDIIIRLLENNKMQIDYYNTARNYLNNHYKFINHLHSIKRFYKMDCIMYKSGYYSAKVYFKVRCLLVKILKGGRIV